MQSPALGLAAFATRLAIELGHSAKSRKTSITVRYLVGLPKPWGRGLITFHNQGTRKMCKPDILVSRACQGRDPIFWQVRATLVRGKTGETKMANTLYV